MDRGVHRRGVRDLEPGGGGGEVLGVGTDPGEADRHARTGRAEPGRAADRLGGVPQQRSRPGGSQGAGPSALVVDLRLDERGAVAGVAQRQGDQQPVDAEGLEQETGRGLHGGGAVLGEGDGPV